MPYLDMGSAFVPIEKLSEDLVRRHVEGFASGDDPLRHLQALAKLGVLDSEDWIKRLRSS